MKKISKVEKVNNIELSSKKLLSENNKNYNNESKGNNFKQILEEKLNGDKVKVRKKF